MGGKSGGTKGLKDVAKVQRELGTQQVSIAKEYLDFSKKQYAGNQKFVKQVLDAQLPAMRNQLKASQEDRTRYLNYFAPLEESFAKQAAGYDTTARRESEAAKASADVATAADAQRHNAAMALESYGIDPSTTRAQAIDRQVGVAAAAQEAQAAQQARLDVENRGLALKQGAINIGRGYPAQVAGEAAGAVQAGTAATGVHAVPGEALSHGYGVAGSYFGNAGNAMSGSTQSYSTVNAAANQTPWLNTLGALGGTAGGIALAKYMAKGGTPEYPGPAPRKTGIMLDPDTVPAMIGKHEYVVPSDVVVHKGTEFLDKVVDKSRSERYGISDRSKPDAGGGPAPGRDIMSSIARIRGQPLPQPAAPPALPTSPEDTRPQPPQGDAAMRELLGHVIGLRGPHWTH